MLKFELSEQMIQIIGDALGAHVRSTQLAIAELQKQITAQQPTQPLSDEVKADDPAPD